MKVVLMNLYFTGGPVVLAKLGLAKLGDQTWPNLDLAKLGLAPEGGGVGGWGAGRWGPKVAAPNSEKVEPRSVGLRRAGPRRVGGPKFRAFCSLSRPHFRSFSLSGGLLVEFWWCLKLQDPVMCGRGRLLAKPTLANFSVLVFWPNFLNPKKTPPKDPNPNWGEGGRPFGAPPFGPIYSGFGVVVVMVVVVIVGLDFPGPPAGPLLPSSGPPSARPPKISLFFPLPPPFRSFCVSLGVFSWKCLKRRDPEMCTFGVLGLSCGQNTEKLKLAKVGLAKVGHPNFGQNRSIKVGRSRSIFLWSSDINGVTRVGASQLRWTCGSFCLARHTIRCVCDGCPAL